MKQHIKPSESASVFSLARLRLDAAKSDRLTADLERVLEYVDRLSSVSTDAPDAYGLDPVGIADLRRDEALAFGDSARLMPRDRIEKGLLVTKGIFVADDETHVVSR